MPDKWTGELLGRMHNERVTRKELAKQLGVGSAYVTMVLNGNRNPPNAEQRFFDAFTAVLKARESNG